MLIVDDVADNRALITHHVTRMGFEPETAENGEEGLSKALHQTYDIILMDLQMPDMDGFEAVKKLRRANYTAPIIALTAHAMKGDREKCLTSGFDDYLCKPINKDLLKESVFKFLEKKN